MCVSQAPSLQTGSFGFPGRQAQELLCVLCLFICIYYSTVLQRGDEKKLGRLFL